MNDGDNKPSWLYDEEEQQVVPAHSNDVSPTHMPGWLKHPAYEQSSAKSTLQKPNRQGNDNAQRRSLSAQQRIVDDDSCCPDNPWLLFFRIFHLFSGIFATLAFITNIYYVFYSSVGLRNKVIHLYAALFSLQIVAIELEVPFVMTRLRIMEWWIIRGFLYLFVGCLTIEENADIKKYHLSLFIQNISGLAVSIIAALYILMGLCCINRLVPHEDTSGDNKRYQDISTNVTPAKG